MYVDVDADDVEEVIHKYTSYHAIYICVCLVNKVVSNYIFPIAMVQ